MITDSGLGGLSICAAIERAWRVSGGSGLLRLTYINAWPFEDRGYNDLPDMPARADVFDRALARMLGWRPDRILIACNTLSIIYRLTAFSRSPGVPVHGIIDAGIDLFVESLSAEPASAILLLGTKTTIESGVHREALVARGIDPARITAVHCHGLAGAIEKDPDSAAVGDLIETCAARAAAATAAGRPVFAGLCCTHYGYVADRLRAALEPRLGAPVRCLDPNARMVADLARGSQGPETGGGTTAVEVVSKVTLDAAAREGIGRLVEPVSAATARALLSYSRVPDLF
ncbi:MAG: aspartate/glutamate racemase family protein [Acidobacteria bacterium]|nr:aspartate/glutamate racemase family protein [Acidobacteriota bacterium]